MAILTADGNGTSSSSSSSSGAAAAPKQRSNWRREKSRYGPMFLSPEVVTPRGPQFPGDGGDLPATPTWVPRLTPSRRGDDLYLNVH